MDTRCCTPPAMSGDELFLSSCRHRLFMNEEDENDTNEALLETSITMRPSESLPRPSESRASGDTRPSDAIDAAVELPSPTRLPRSPRRAFQPIPINLPPESCFGRTGFQSWPVDGGASTSTPWRPSANAARPSLNPAPVMRASADHLMTPEVQRAGNAAAATPGMLGHLLFTPQVPPVCQTWRANLDAELDGVATKWSPDQLPLVTPLIERGLYVGGSPDAQTVAQLHALGVRHIVNCCAQDVRTAPEVTAQFCVHHFEAYDSPEYLILHRNYDAFAKLVSTLRAGGETVFVHCIAGVNRSVTLCAAYLMDSLSLDPVEAVRVFRANGRMRILDNHGFRHQLVDHYLQGLDSRGARLTLL